MEFRPEWLMDPQSEIFRWYRWHKTQRSWSRDLNLAISWIKIWFVYSIHEWDFVSSGSTNFTFLKRGRQEPSTSSPLTTLKTLKPSTPSSTTWQKRRAWYGASTPGQRSSRGSSRSLILATERISNGVLWTGKVSRFARLIAFGVINFKWQKGPQRKWSTTATKEIFLGQHISHFLFSTTRAKYICINWRTYLHKIEKYLDKWKKIFQERLSHFLFSPTGAKYRPMFKFDGTLVCGQPAPTGKHHHQQIVPTIILLVLVSSVDSWLLTLDC